MCLATGHWLGDRQIDCLTYVQAIDLGDRPIDRPKWQALAYSRSTPCECARRKFNNLHKCAFRRRTRTWLSSFALCETFNLTEYMIWPWTTGIEHCAVIRPACPNCRPDHSSHLCFVWYEPTDHSDNRRAWNFEYSDGFYSRPSLAMHFPCMQK